MSALVKKEVRLLLPTFLSAVAIALLSVFFHRPIDGWSDGVGYFLGGIFFPAVVIMLALNTFGVEVGTQTFSMMLAQPVTRQRIWQTKISLLALTLAAVGVVWYLAVVVPTQYFHQQAFTGENQADLTASVVLFGLVVFSGSLWTVLLLRQVAAAFWFTLIVPGVLTGSVAALCNGSSDEFILAMLTTVLGLYSLAGFFFARWLFFRAQDLQWTGGNIVMPEWRGLARLRAAAGNIRMRRPTTALWRKEIQLHQSQLVIAFVLFLLHLGVLAVRGLCDLHNSPDLRAVLEGFWVLWLVMPFLIGCAAVAEERKLGTHEGQLCLPVKRRTQFIVKLLVALGLSIFLGMLMPMLLEAHRFLADHPRKPEDWFILPGIPVLVCAVAFYVSTMARNTLQTLAPAVLGVVVVWPILILASGPWYQGGRILGGGPVGYFITLPILVITLAWLTYTNFQRVLTGWQLASRNLLALLSALVLGTLLTSAVYHRFWENFMPFEPSHGAPRLSLSNPPNLDANWAALTVRQPDGNVWSAPVASEPIDTNSWKLWLGDVQMPLADGHYLAGTNWLNVEHAYWITAGLETDGTLWLSKNPWRPRDRSIGRTPDEARQLDDLVRFGGDTNWTSIQVEGGTVLLTKSDGTLWRLDDKFHPTKQSRTPPPLEPEQIGAGTDWAQVTQCNYLICLYKTDGTAWLSGNWGANNQPFLQVGPNLVVHRVPAFDHHQMRSTATITHGLTFGVGVRSDGTFRIWAHERPNQVHSYGFVSTLTDQQIGAGTNWVAVAANSQGLVTLKNDGTLWRWDIRNDVFGNWDPLAFDGEIARTVPIRLGTHSDWIALSGNYALAADGSVWFWPLMDAREVASFAGMDNPQNWHPLLDISHKPQFLGNIFTAAN